MAYDAATKQIVLFGGQSATPVNGGLPPLADTWTWDGSTWSQQTPALSPPATVNMSIAYEAATQTLIGVRDNDATGISETWQWNGTTWALLQPALRPTNPKQGAGMAFGSATTEVTMFGTVFSIIGPPPEGNTWTFASNTWTAHAASANTPKPRSFPAMSEDTRGGVLMFGGGGTGFTVFNDTWTWYQGQWVQLTVSPAPQARTMPVMAYDSGCRVVLLYGGEVPTGQNVTVYNDTWAWNGQTWTKVG